MTPNLGTCLIFMIFIFLHINILMTNQHFEHRAHVNNDDEDFNISKASTNFEEFPVIKKFRRKFGTEMLTTLENSTENTTLNKDLSFESSFCSAHCLGDKLVYVPSLEACPSNRVNCFPCNCNRPQCGIYGTCCPHLSPQKIRLKRPETVVKCDSTSINGMTFLYIRSCPKHFYDHHVIEMCVDDIPAHEQTTDSFARAYDNDTGTVYYNIYCAECNNVTTPTMWQVTVNCEHHLRVFTARSGDELLRLSLKENSSCPVVQDVPVGLSLHQCQSDWYREVTDSCNVTGLWSVTDDNVSSQCESNTDMLQVVASGCNSDTYYKNVFCAICNTGLNLEDIYKNYVLGLTKICECDSCFATGGSNFGVVDRKIVLPFSLLLGSIVNDVDPEPSDSGMKLMNCSISEWSSPDNKCLAIQCAPGKDLRDTTCGTSVNTIRGLGYIASVLYLPNKSKTNDILSDSTSQDFRNNSQLLDQIIEHFQNELILDPALAETELHIVHVQNDWNFNKTDWNNSHAVSNVKDYLEVDKTICPSQTDHSEYLFYLTILFVANQSISRDDFENYVLNVLQLRFTEMQNNFRILLEPLLVPDLPDFESCLLESPTKRCHTEYSSSIQDSNKNIWSYKSEFLQLSAILNCPHVSFNQSEYTISANCSIFPPTWKISLNLGSVTLSFSELADLNRLLVSGYKGSGNGHLNVCLDLLEEKVQEIKKKQKSLKFEINVAYLWQYYLTQVCLGMSMICLLFTLLIFSLFPALRNNAGTNNMFLSGTLFLAQASLLCSVHVEGPNWLCFAVGISTHFLWLSMTCWSFICCLHMFRVFTAKTATIQSTSNSRKIILIKKILASTLTPAVIIATVMVATYLTSDGQRFGYTDRNPCYLDSRLLIVSSFVTPLGIVCIVNLLFFLSTIYKIHEVRKLQAHPNVKKRELETFTIYIKLSTMTGSLWIASIVSETTNNDPLRFVTIILNGLQGVFLFLSFICNKRVMTTCLKPLVLQKFTSATNGTSSAGDFNKRTIDQSLTS